MKTFKNDNNFFRYKIEWRGFIKLIVSASNAYQVTNQQAQHTGRMSEKITIVSAVNRSQDSS